MKMIADTHCHTLASSHAYSTLMENINCAKQKGLIAIAMTDHAPNMPDAPHIWHILNQSVIPDFVEGIAVLKGVEANIIDYEGHLDVPQNILSELDWVIASFHQPCCEPGTLHQHTQAWISVARNPHVDVIGHSGTPAYTYDFASVIPIFKEYDKLVEINNNSLISAVRSGSKENCIEIAKLCKKYEVPVIVNSDSHFCTSVGCVDGALQMLSEIDFPKRLIVNADQDRFIQEVHKRAKTKFLFK